MVAHQTHPRWREVLEGLHRAGLAKALFPASLPARLGSAATRPPEPNALTALLDAYYRGDGDVDAGLVRFRTDRIVLHRERDRATARQIVARLRLAAPELGPLGLIEESGGRLVLRTYAAQEALAPQLLEREPLVLDGVPFERRTIEVRSLVVATNTLLSRRQIPFRFVPLALADSVEAYVALDPADVLVLDAEGLLDEPLDAVRAMARWDRGPLVVYDPNATRRVA